MYYSDWVFNAHFIEYLVDLALTLTRCGGSNDPAASNDGLDGIMNGSASKKSSSNTLDKYTMQEKIVPLIRAIKTKEPTVAMAALNVLRQIGGVADAEFVALDLLPVLWSMSLGPLLDLQQFQAFQDLIKSLSSRVESEQTKKLQVRHTSSLQFEH
jgi:SCY1-like protein 2